MSTGDSLILIAIVLAICFVIYKIHQKQKWKLFGKIVGVLIIIGLLIGAGTYAYYWYDNLPYEATQLGKVSLDMTPVEVTLQLGKPNGDNTNESGVRRFVYMDYGSVDYFVKFEKDTSGIERVTTVCSGDYMNDIFGLGVYDSEKNIIKKLGEPSNTSVNKDGLSKMISYEKWKVAFLIEKGEVKQTCITKSGKVAFAEEYK